MRATNRVDLTLQTKQWNRIQFAGAIALFFALDNIATTIFDVLKIYVEKGMGGDYQSLWMNFPLFLLSLFVLRQTWRHGSVFSGRSLKMLRYTFGISAVFAFLLIVFLGLVWVWANASGERIEHGVNMGLMYGTLGAAMILIYCVIVTFSIKNLTNSRIEAIGRPMRELLENMTERVKEPAPAAYGHIRIDQPAGVFWVLLGAVVFFIGAALGSFIWEYWMNKLDGKGNVSQMMQVSTLVEIAGAILVLKGRTYFTPKAEAVLAIDKRRPILYLRSFLDEKPDGVQWSGMYSGFVDRSLEMKVAKYFLPFGPFVAIGSPKDNMPKLGATRLMRSDADWQGEVLHLMESAQLILASVGNSKWIKWELAESFRRGLEAKSLFIFPVTIQRGWRLKKKRAAQQAERIEAMKELYSPTDCPDFGILEPDEFLLAQITTGAQTTLITSKLPGANSQVLSIVVGHYILGQGQTAARAG